MAGRLLLVVAVVIVTFSDILPVSVKAQGSEVPDWFLSISGSDSETCGWSESTACRTLDWLLGRFYTTYYSYNHSLSLITDTSLAIHSKLVKRHPWMNGLTVKISAADSYTEEELHVSLKDVTITDVTLTISDLNVFMFNAFLANTIVYLRQSYSFGSAVISNTTFRQLKAKGFQIRVANCFIDGDTEFQPPLFDIVDSELTISKSIFYRITGWEGPLLITAWFSRVIIKDVKFIENQGRRGLVHVNFGSEFMLENSLFVENGEIDRDRNPSNNGGGSAIVVKSNSVAIVNHCKFIGNEAVMGSCIRTIGRDVRLVVTNSTFVNNSAYYGGAISCSGRPRGGKLGNVSAEVAPNRQHDPQRQIPGRSIKDGYDGFVNNDNNDNMLSQCDVIRSSFKSTDQEGAVHFRNAKGKIFESSFFSRNTEMGKLGKSAKLPSRSGFDSVVRTSEETFIEIVNSTYESRYGEMVGFVSVGEAFLASKMEAQFAKSGDWGSVKHRFINEKKHVKIPNGLQYIT